MQSKSNATPKVSIIVPMYNVEEFIYQCVSSIQNQTYQNIEVILINDGSPDNSGEIANQIALSDSRIRVIHTPNHGVSSARNLGIKEARGQYLIFVDGDDILSSDNVDYMLTLIDQTNSDFALSENCFKIPGDEHQIENDKIESWNSEEAATALMYPGKIEIGCWNKIFKRKFLTENEIYFSEDFYMGEGLKFIVTSAQKSDLVGVGRRKVYFYRKNNTNSATTVLNVPKYINAIAAIDSISKSKLIDSHSFDKAIEYHRYLTVFFSLRAMLLTNRTKEYQSIYKEYVSYIRCGALKIFKINMPFSMKIRVLAHCIHPKFATKIMSIFRGVRGVIIR